MSDILAANRTERPSEDHRKFTTETLAANAEQYSLRETAKNESRNLYESISITLASYIADKFLAYDLIGVQPIELDPEVEPLEGIGQYYLMSVTTEPINGMFIRIDKHDVEFTARNFSVKWNVIDADMAWVGEKVLIELNKDLLSSITAIARPMETTLEQLPWRLRSQATMIGQRTRRGSGNWCVTAPTYVDRLIQGGGFEQTAEVSNEKVVQIGVMSGIKVFCDPHRDDILIGYKGNQIDCGMVYCPLLPVMISSVTIDPSTFSPLMNLQTVSGFGFQTRENGRMCEASDYYVRLEVA